MKTTERRTITSHHLYLALRARLPEAAWALFREVRNGTGFSRSVRTADAIAMSLWPSRGLELHGFEFKVSRSDWLTELKHPEKAEAICRYCDRWWLVVGHGDIVQAGELPTNWGLLVLKGKRLQAAADAAKLNAQPLDRLMLASLLRSATTGVVPASTIKTEVDAAIKERLEAERAATQQAEQRYQEMRRSVLKFEQETGISIGWSKPAQREMYRRIAAAESLDNTTDRLNWILEEEKHRLRILQQAIDAIATYKSPVPTIDAQTSSQCSE